MNCSLCHQSIALDDAVNMHHPVYRSNGGTDTEPMHKACHVALHSSRDDFRDWGRIGGQVSALSRQWAFNLRGVNAHPAHDLNRQFNRAFYAQ